MAHLVETMAYAGDVPWHGLGVPVSGDLTPPEMMNAANLNWEVYKSPAFTEIDGEQITLNQSALVRSSDNAILDVVSNDWEPVQNAEAFDFFEKFVKAGRMHMHTAGSLDGGRIVWALAQITEGTFELFGGDVINPFLLFTNPHRYGKSIDVRLTPIRVVCNNTLTLALGKKTEFNIKFHHRRAFNPDLAEEALGLATIKIGKYERTARFLGSKRAKEKDVVEFFKDVFPPTSGASETALSRVAQQALDIVPNQPGNEFAPGSWWQAYNAVSYMIDHVLGRSADTRLQSAWYGQNKNKKIKALELAVDYAEAA